MLFARTAPSALPLAVLEQAQTTKRMGLLLLLRSIRSLNNSTNTLRELASGIAFTWRTTLPLLVAANKLGMTAF